VNWMDFLLERLTQGKLYSLFCTTSSGLDTVVQKILRVVQPEAVPVIPPARNIHVEKYQPHHDLHISESLMDDPDAVSALTATEMKELISQVRPFVENEENLIQGPKGDILAVGDTHGDFGATKYIVNLWKDEHIDNLVFLGDYVDRGEQQLENINFLLALKLLYPDRVVLLRGNHETPSVNSYYGFLSACNHAFGEEAKEMYYRYNDVFSYFSPAYLSRRILFLHGGIPRGLHNLEEIRNLEKGDKNAGNDILGQILWNDPSELCEKFKPNRTRGIHNIFGKKVFREFLETHDLTMVIRAHEVFPQGYKYFFDHALLSIFSSPHYRGVNKAKVAHISEDGEISLLGVEAEK
jgi:protein phosphatase